MALWLEAYLGDGDTPAAFVKFAPPTLAAKELDQVRADLKREWDRRDTGSSLRHGGETSPEGDSSA